MQTPNPNWIERATDELPEELHDDTFVLHELFAVCFGAITVLLAAFMLVAMPMRQKASSQMHHGAVALANVVDSGAVEGTQPIETPAENEPAEEESEWEKWGRLGFLFLLVNACFTEVIVLLVILVLLIITYYFMKWLEKRCKKRKKKKKKKWWQKVIAFVVKWICRLITVIKWIALVLAILTVIAIIVTIIYCIVGSLSIAAG